MSIVVLASAKGSPGVTTTALALTTTWPLAPDAPDGAPRVALVDADLAGSGIAAGHLRGAVPDGGSLVHEAVAHTMSRRLDPRTIAIDETGRRGVLLGINDPVQGRSVAPALVPVIEALHEQGDVLVDLGRLTTLSTEHPVADVVDAAALTVVVCRSTLASVSAARHLAARLQVRANRAAPARRVKTLVVGPGRPYPSKDVASAIGAAVLAEIAWDPASAAVFSDGEAPRWRFAQSPLLRSARAAAVLVHRWATPTPRPVPSAEPDVVVTRG